MSGDDRRLRADVLVIGSGGAGLAAALSAFEAGASVTIATKLGVASCNTAKAQGGIQAAVGADDSPDQHLDDMVASSHGTCDVELARVLVEGGPAAIEWLGRQGVEFACDVDGQYQLLTCGGATRARLLQSGDQTGLAITRALRAKVAAANDVAVLDHHPIIDLEPGGDGGFRARLEHRRGADALERVEVEAGAVVLCAGGRCHRVAQEQGIVSTNAAGATGEVTELALALGASVRDYDSLQLHPTGGVWPQGTVGFAVPETARSLGAVLRNADGERFVDELSGRDVVANAIIAECEAGRGITTDDGRPAVLLDTTPIEGARGAGAIERMLPFLHRRYLAAGIDLTREGVLVYPVLHYQNGGLVHDMDGCVGVPGLHAAGEICGGVHGINRMMGNSLLETIVFGRRAGRAASRYALRARLTS